MTPDNTIHDDEDDAFGELDSGASYTFRELIDLLNDKGEIIVTIPEEQLEALRKGLAVRKSKDNAKLKNAGVLPDTRTLSFNAYPTSTENVGSSDETAEISKTIDVRIKLAARKGVTVINLSVPDDKF